MRKISDSYGVYAEFFTNGAVAWFTAGVITQIFTKTHTNQDFLSSALAIFFCLLFLQIAKFFTKEEK